MASALLIRSLYGNVQKGTGNDKQIKDAGNRTLCPYKSFSQAIIHDTTRFEKHSCVCFDGANIWILCCCSFKFRQKRIYSESPNYFL